MNAKSHQPHSLEVYKSRVRSRVQRPLFVIPVSAGNLVSVESYVEGYLDPAEMLIKHPAETFFVKVRGDSMIDDGIDNGDTLVVDRRLEATDGKVVVAIVDGELTVKRFEQRGPDLRLVPANKKYSPIQIRAGQDFEVWGVVTFVIKRL